ncbi:hypothetical protein C8Q73DRAFT_666015 [Cubamyces lactineus]|nr:hypothetical protein C8Q73DRAFT_666015 [Cubamyces lactineus]
MLAPQPPSLHHHHPYALPASAAAAAANFVNKDAQPNHLYLHQQRTVEVIQLIEVPPPPPRTHPYSSSFASSSFASSSSYDSSDSEEDESVCSSYCSSDEESEANQPPAYDDTYKIRLNRVLAWREGFAKAVGGVDEDVSLPVPPSTPVSSSPASSRKRKANSDVDFDLDDDMSSQTSKRSRSIPPEEPVAWQQRCLSAHSCPACDAGFSSLQSLRQHGKESAVNDACREAVEYGFEP